MVQQAFWRHEHELVELCFGGMANDMRKLLDEFEKAVAVEAEFFGRFAETFGTGSSREEA